jgi:hypothetical protein
LRIAKKKAVRDYRESGDSSIIFVFNHELFWDSDPKHVNLLQSLKEQLSEIPQMANNVLLMLIFGDQKRIIEVKSTERIRIDCESVANQDLILWLNKPGVVCGVCI